ncbi:MAG: DUF2325 domain-containing protein [Acidovorax sp.]
MGDAQELAVPPLEKEYSALASAYGSAQLRCSELVSGQAREIERLTREVIRLRAAVIMRETALMWEREDRTALERAIPGLPRRVTLVRCVETLLAKVQDLMRERARWQQYPERESMGRRTIQRGASPEAPVVAAIGSERDAGRLEASLTAADLVICQTGCLSHGAYWRVQDHCKRTGKACVMVDQPQTLRIVRISKDADGAERATLAPVLHGL